MPGKLRRRRALGPRTTHRVAALVVRAALFGPIVAACGNGPDLSHLSSSAQNGYQLAEDSGCLACHGSEGEGGVGPAWQALYESTVPLDDGTTVVADRDYLRLSISDPGAQRVEGYTVFMPPNGLTGNQIEDVIDYIEAIR